MKQAIKKRKVIHAYRLGDRSPMELRLIEAGLLRRTPDGSYELFSRESVNGMGEVTLPGEWFRVEEKDGQLLGAYPISPEVIRAAYRRTIGAAHETVPRPLPVWQAGDPVPPEVQTLLDAGLLELHPEDPEHYYRAVVRSAPLSAPQDATLVFDKVDGVNSDFKLVRRDYFEDNYTLL